MWGGIVKNQELTIKVYEVDYSFIIKNYLEPKMWEKKWTIFTYKNFKYELWIEAIYTQEEKIYFKLRVTDMLSSENYRTDWGIADNYYDTSVIYSLKINDIKFLKNKINSTMIEITKHLEERAIIGTDEYRELENGENDEEKRLRKIAEEFLDSEDVHNEEIRDVYIDNFIENNSKISELKSDLIRNKRYNIFTDLYFILEEKTKDRYLAHCIENKFNEEEIEEVKKSISEYLEYIETEEWKNEKEENLEGI